MFWEAVVTAVFSDRIEGCGCHRLVMCLRVRTDGSGCHRHVIYLLVRTEGGGCHRNVMCLLVRTEEAVVTAVEGGGAGGRG